MNFLFKNEVIDYDFLNINKLDTIIFIHGWGGNKLSFSKTINLLKPNYNILTITIPTTLPTILSWDMFDYVNLVNSLIEINSIINPIVVCHSFGCRLAILLSKKITIKKLVITGGAGIKKVLNIFEKITKNNNQTLLKNSKFKYLYKFITFRANTLLFSLTILFFINFYFLVILKKLTPNS